MYIWKIIVLIYIILVFLATIIGVIMEIVALTIEREPIKTKKETKERKSKEIFKKKEKLIMNILTDKEWDYLKAIVKPFMDRVLFLKKRQDYEYECIILSVKVGEDSFMDTVLPCFEKGKYYKGMKVDKKYTLEELDIYEGPGLSFF